jgi:hypothetical protein
MVDLEQRMDKSITRYFQHDGCQFMSLEECKKTINEVKALMPAKAAEASAFIACHVAGKVSFNTLRARLNDHVGDVVKQE